MRFVILASFAAMLFFFIVHRETPSATGVRPSAASDVYKGQERACVTGTLHQLRHSHATELVNGGVNLATIRKRLGHQHIQTTLRYAEVSDQTADTEVRRWRRKQ